MRKAEIYQQGKLAGTLAEIDRRVAGGTESNAGRVRLLGYRVGAANAGLNLVHIHDVAAGATLSLE